MRTLKRNQVEFRYANVVGTQPVFDADGYETGETQPLYGKPIRAFGNISASKGAAELELFGLNTNYTKTVIPDDPALPIDKSTILWIDNEPDDAGEAGAVKHDYVVAAAAKSLNSLTIAVREVDVS